MESKCSPATPPCPLACGPLSCVAEVAKWATSKGFGEFAPALLKHAIRCMPRCHNAAACFLQCAASGDVLPILGEQQLREIGFGLVGPRMMFQRELVEVQRGVIALLEHS